MEKITHQHRHGRFVEGNYQLIGCLYRLLLGGVRDGVGTTHRICGCGMEVFLGGGGEKRTCTFLNERIKRVADTVPTKL